jgi:hypothetical protein
VRLQVAALLVADLYLEPRHDLAEGTATDPTRLVGEEDVPHLRRAHPVQERDAEERVPSSVHLDWQRLTS